MGYQLPPCQTEERNEREGVVGGVVREEEGGESDDEKGRIEKKRCTTACLSGSLFCERWSCAPDKVIVDVS